MINNNKGFSLVELLGVIVIFGILATVATVGTTHYLQDSRESSFLMMSQSIYLATENCMIENKCIPDNTYDIKTLKEMKYLDNIKSPGDKSKDCTGTVKIYSNSSSSIPYGFKKYKYDVSLTCQGVNKKEYKNLTWPDAKVKIK